MSIILIAATSVLVSSSAMFLAIIYGNSAKLFGSIISVIFSIIILIWVSIEEVSIHYISMIFLIICLFEFLSFFSVYIKSNENWTIISGASLLLNSIATSVAALSGDGSAFTSFVVITLIRMITPIIIIIIVVLGRI